MQMQRPPMDGAPDALRAKRVNKGVSIHGQSVQYEPHGKQVPGVDAIGVCRGQLQLCEVTE
jgi:hypothetical protein